MMDDRLPVSIVKPSQPFSSTCGYCSPKGQRSKTRSSKLTASLNATQLSCAVYQDMIDRGWRRSGTFCYKPDMKRTCCPQYTIKLDAGEFKASRSQRKIISRWNRFVLNGARDEGEADEVTLPAQLHKTHDSKRAIPLVALHDPENVFLQGKTAVHNFEVVLEPSSFTDEKYELFRHYQTEIHKDRGVTEHGFWQFLINSPLIRTPISYSSTKPVHLPDEYGSFHQLYRLDGKLIAMSVIDILPKSVSSVYFMYDPDWGRYSFGKLSTFREILLLQELRAAGARDVTFLYMGYYIHSCPKMRYKGEYSPSYLLDPEQYTWHPLEQCIPILNGNTYARFFEPTHSVSVNHSLAQEQEDEEALAAVPDESLGDMMISSSLGDGSVSVSKFRATRAWHSKNARRALAHFASELGAKLAKEVIIDAGQVGEGSHL